MTLVEAIKHADDEYHRLIESNCIKCAEEHKQLHDWLVELDRYRDDNMIRGDVDMSKNKTVMVVGGDLRDGSVSLPVDAKILRVDFNCYWDVVIHIESVNPDVVGNRNLVEVSIYYDNRVVNDKRVVVPSGYELLCMWDHEMSIYTSNYTYTYMEKVV